jgi:hypothetical protein
MSKKMKPRPFALFLISSTLLAAGCAYRGAVYSEFTTAGIDLRADATSGAPVRFVFGYDRGVGAYVPRRNAGTTDSQGEAVSVVSWSYLRTTPAPTQQNANKTAISVDAGFITGTAAQVIAAPDGFKVIIEEPVTPSATGTPSGNVTGLFSAQGDPGTRIATAASVRSVRPDTRDTLDKKNALITCVEKIDDKAKLEAIAREFPPTIPVVIFPQSSSATRDSITSAIANLSIDELKTVSEFRQLQDCK